MIRKSIVRGYLRTFIETPKNKFDKVLKAWDRGIGAGMAGLLTMTALATNNMINLTFTIWLALGIFFAIYFFLLRGK